MIPVARVAKVMGLKRPVRSFAELEKMVARGLPKSALKHSVAKATRDPGEQRRLMFKIVPKATLERRLRLLKPDESERTQRLALVIATAEYVWDDDAQAERFLTTPHATLDGRRPIDAATSELGARQVEALLWDIFYGLAA